MGTVYFKIPHSLAGVWARARTRVFLFSTSSSERILMCWKGEESESLR